MEYLVQFQINIFGLMILFVLYLFVRMAKIQTFSKRLIKFIVMTTAIAIVMEPLTWIFDGMIFIGAFYWEYISNFILFLIGPIIGGLLLSYVDFRIYKEPKRIQRLFYYQQASVITLILLIINLFYPIYFSVNSLTNSFSSGEFKMIHYFILAMIYFYMLYFVIKNIRRTLPYEALIYCLCFFFPIAGMLVQLFDSKLHFSWTSIVLGLLVIYIFLETSPSEEDYLTRLYNRRSYEVYLTHLTQSSINFGVIIFDLNSFKEINDRNGHHKGDEVLVAFAQILKKVFQKNGFVSRLGGDEFAVIVLQRMDDIDFFIREISDQLARYSDPIIQQLTFSYGYEQRTNTMTMDELYIAADKKMYKNKKEVKDA